MLRKIAFSNQKDIKEEVIKLYESAFPIEERPPTKRFFSILKKKYNQLFVYYDDDEFIGFTFLTFYQDVCYLFFLAVKEEKRHHGYGGQILEIIKSEYRDFVILICYEEVNPQYPNYEERVAREKFYLSHGFKNNKMKTDEFGVVYQSAYIGCHTVSFETYVTVFEIGFGKFARRFLKEAK